MALTRALVFSATLMTSGAAVAQAPDLSLQHVAGHVHVIQGKGGNIGVSIGDDGVFLVDDQFAPQVPAVREAIAAETDAPIRFVLNTHWHFDHTGGNEKMAEAGALIVAHENVRERMSSEQFIQAMDRTVPASPDAALPVVTYTAGVTFHLNGDTIAAEYLAPGHTDGDSLVHFVEADVIHAGDVMFNGLYPLIDVSTGGDVDGMLSSVDRILVLAGSDTRIIPGHGPVTDRKGVRAYRHMLQTIRDRVAAMVADGASRDDVIAAKPTQEFDAKWGGGFLSPDVFAGIVYDSLVD